MPMTINRASSKLPGLWFVVLAACLIFDSVSAQTVNPTANQAKSSPTAAISKIGTSTALESQVDALYQEIEGKIDGVPYVVARDLVAMTAGAPIYVDVRSPAERAVSVIPGAITLDQLGSVYQAKPREIVVYCTVGYRSGLAVRELRAKHLPARNLRGGILAWLAAGGTLNDSAQKPTHQVHVYAQHWAVVPPIYSARF
jgi:rhodanese-related sulfurtransferase